MSRRREPAFPYRWVWARLLHDRKGQRCRLVHAPDAPDRFSRVVTVEFEDGHRQADVARTAVRRA